MTLLGPDRVHWWLWWISLAEPGHEEGPSKRQSKYLLSKPFTFLFKFLLQRKEALKSRCILDLFPFLVAMSAKLVVIGELMKIRRNTKWPLLEGFPSYPNWTVSVLLSRNPHIFYPVVWGSGLMPRGDNFSVVEDLVGQFLPKFGEKKLVFPLKLVMFCFQTIIWNYPPPRIPVTTRIIPFLVGNQSL